MKKFIAILITCIVSAHAYSDTKKHQAYCYKAEKCQAGDIIILEFTTMAKLNMTRRVAEVCDFDKTIYTYETSMKKLNVACVYTGIKRIKRKKTK